MKKLFYILFVIILFSCDYSKNPQVTDPSLLSFEDKNMGSEEWKLKEIESIKADSATLRDVDYKDISNGTNKSMANAIDFLSSHNPSWSGYREAYDDFYSKDKRASIPIAYIVKTSKSKLNQVLPSYRKSFAQNMAKALWKQDIYVTASGSQNTILNMTGGIFAANQNIADMQAIIKEDAEHFGFKEIRYRWYKGADEYTYYKFE